MPRTEQGAAAVEFALILPILLMIIFGIIAFGQFYSQFQVFQGAAREGARIAAVRAPADDVIARVKTASEPYELTQDPVVSVDSGGSQCDDDASGDLVTVAWTQGFDISMPFVPNINADVDIQGVFRCE